MTCMSASRALGRRLFVVALISVIAVSEAQESPNAEKVTPRAQRAFGQKRTVRGINNFGEVTPTLFRGGQPTDRAFESLAKMGIAIVVDARGNRADGEGREVERLGMKYVSIPWHCPFPHDDVFVKFLKLVQDNPEKKIFVHCRLGDDRTGMMVAAYRMAREGWTADEAMLEMQHFGFSSAHHFICPGLASYERNFLGHLKSNPEFYGLH
jgi:tyrosine-protein phosphatase SIW14